MKNHQVKSKIINTKILLFIPSLLIIITILCGVVLLPSSTHANTEQSNVSVIVNSTCSITTGGGSYAKVVSPGTTEEIAGNGINVTCNDSNGYALYTSGYSGDSYNTVDSTRMLAAAGSNYIPTGTNGSSSAYGSYWAMKAVGTSSLTPSTTPTIDNSFDDYREVPSTYTKISHYTGSTLGTTTNSVTTPTYKVYVGTAQPASTYIGKVKYTLVHPNDVPVANYMQNWNGCSAIAIGAETFLIDSRDNKVYNVVKFNDGKCWMTTNLDLAGGTALSSTDTDFDSSYTLPATNGWTVSDGKLVMPASSTTGFDTDNYAYVYNSGRTSTSDSGCRTPGCYSYYSWDTATVGSGRSITADNTDAPYSICPKGWHLPNIRSGTNDTADFRKLMTVLGGSADIQTYNDNTSPTGATIFSGLSSAPLNYLRAGGYNGSTFYNGGSHGLYWSATSNSGTNARYLGFGSTDVNSADYTNRGRGFSVRCVKSS